MSSPSTPTEIPRIYRVLFIIVGVLVVVGLISMTVSVLFAPEPPPKPGATTEINYNEQARAKKAQERHDYDRTKWYAAGVSSVCRNGPNKFPSLAWGGDARIPDMAAALAILIKDMREIAKPKIADNVEAVNAMIERGASLERKWADFATLPPRSLPQVQQFAAVDEVRVYVQDLINAGAADCKQVLPRPNPPLDHPEQAVAPTTPAAPPTAQAPAP